MSRWKAVQWLAPMSILRLQEAFVDDEESCEGRASLPFDELDRLSVAPSLRTRSAGVRTLMVNCATLATTPAAGLTGGQSSSPVSVNELVAMHVNDSDSADVMRRLASSMRVQHVSLSSCTLKNVPARFLSFCCSLRSMDLSTFSQTLQLGARVWDGFGERCMLLTRVDLAPLGNVTVLGNSFLMGCSQLRSIDLQPLRHVREVGNAFLSGCHGLKSVDLSPMRLMMTIRFSFLSDCVGLQKVTFGSLPMLSEIGPWFLRGCRMVKSVDLTGLTQLRSNPAAGQDFGDRTVLLPPQLTAQARAAAASGAASSAV